MSWHFSQALLAAYSEHTSHLGGDLCAEWKLAPFVLDELCSDKLKGIFHHSQYGMMYVPSTDINGEGLLTWFLEGSRVRTSVRQESVWEYLEPVAGSGVKWRGSLARSCRTMPSSKTPHSSSVEDLTSSCATLPRWGWMHDGEFFPRVDLVPHTHVIDCSLWPTPRASMGKSGWGHGQPGLGRYRKSVIDRCNAIGWTPSSEMLEAVLGIPIGWTGVEPLGTDKIRSWLPTRGEHCL